VTSNNLHTKCDDSPLVTIVTPTYNQAHYLTDTIESVLAQDYKNIEYIIINDGSTDNTQAILTQYNGRIHWKNQNNLGQANALNNGWSIAKGKYLSYLSSDDILYPEAIRKLVHFINDAPNRIAVYPNCNLIDPYSKIIKRNAARVFNYDELVIKQECCIGPGALFLHDAYIKYGGWLPWLKLAPDREFWMRIGLYGSIDLLNEPLAGYRMHPNSISYSETRSDISNEYLKVLDVYYSRTDIPQHLVVRKSEAYAYARLIMARNKLRNGDISGALNEYRTANHLFPTINNNTVRLMLIRTAVSKPLRKLQWKIRRLCGM